MQQHVHVPVADLLLLTEGKIPDGKRAANIYLPLGKTSAATAESRATRKAMRDAQIDIEDAVEAAGGHRGSLNRTNLA